MRTLYLLQIYYGLLVNRFFNKHYLPCLKAFI